MVELVDAVRGTTVVGVAVFLGVLARYLGQPGYTNVRLVFFTLLALLATTGAVGVFRRSPRLGLGSAGGLALLGLWQAVLWLPLALVVGLLVGATLLHHHEKHPIAG